MAVIMTMMSIFSITVFAEETHSGYRIKIQDGIHYLQDASASDGKIILYCMNNKSNWPHSISGNISEEQAYNAT